MRKHASIVSDVAEHGAVPDNQMALIESVTCKILEHMLGRETALAAATVRKGVSSNDVAIPQDNGHEDRTIEEPVSVCIALDLFNKIQGYMVGFEITILIFQKL